MLHLREILDQVAGEGLVIHETVGKAGRRLLPQLICNLGEEAMCFDMGDIEGVCAIDPVRELMRLPYPTCYFEGSIPDPTQNGKLAVSAYLCTHDGAEDGSIFIVHLIRRANSREWELVQSSKFDRNTGIFFGEPEMNTVAGRDTTAALGPVACFLAALNCVNIERRETRIPTRLNLARAKKGRLPIFSFWTLHINVPRTNDGAANSGGHHQSPRLHLRRGHPRQYAPQKWCWVQPHLVGNKRLGMVHKDYVASIGATP
jgi:hypothetical protein